MFIALLLPIIAAFSTSTKEAEDNALLDGKPSPFDANISCDNPVTLYDAHFCRVFENPEKFQKQCVPTRYLPPSDMPIKGLVINYHGYTACPDSMKPFSKQLSEQGYVVITPLLPGHGINLGFDCKNIHCVQNVNPSEIPTTKEEYINWSNDILIMVNEQLRLIPKSRRADGFKTTAVGLSVGGVLALYATQKAQTPFTNLVMLNPYLSTTVPVLDFMIKNCDAEKDSPKCITRLLEEIINGKPKDSSTWLILEPILLIFRLFKKITIEAFLAFVENTVARKFAYEYDEFWMDLWEKLGFFGDHKELQGLPAFEAGYGWGERCRNTQNRGGYSSTFNLRYCDFYFKNLMGLQAFCTYTLAGLDLIDGDVNIALIHSDIDGSVRDSQSLAVLKAINSRRHNKITRCRFKLAYNRTEILKAVGMTSL